MNMYYYTDLDNLCLLAEAKESMFNFRENYKFKHVVREKCRKELCFKTKCVCQENKWRH